MNQTSTPKVIVLTGASSGIGEATAMHLAREGHHLVVGARRLARLDALRESLRAENLHIEVVEVDVRERDTVQRLADKARDTFGRIDVWINNAGVMPLSPLNALKVDEWELMLDVNVKGVLYGIAAALPVMEQQHAGHIINVASIGAHAVSPTAAVYCASKFAVRAISDGLRQETDKLRVSVISPGVVESELAEIISDDTARDAMRAFRRVAIQPESIARAIGYAIAQPDDVDVSEIIIRPTASPH